ncbi:snake venom serine protease KN13-like [Chironomus tepperi]|uniref:snake venom serine protease KN13-like n=1 Tax=Chironomus tepperi TaxID=113505 RepID=UPI00391EF488
MKSLTVLILTISVYMTDQSFLYSPKNLPKVNTSNTNRFIVNIVEYSFVNGTKTAGKFRCLGTLILKDFVLTTASCVARPDDVQIGIQFETIKENDNEVGYSITFDETTVWMHDRYHISNNETNNVALIKFDPLSITTSPPLFSIFKPKALGSIPKIADDCYIVGRNVHLASPSLDHVFVIGPSSCYGSPGNQAYCTIFNNTDADACKVLQGAPLICGDDKIAGIVLGGKDMCVKTGTKAQLRYHSVGDFSKFLNYYSVGPATTTTQEPTPSAASMYKVSISAFIMVLVYFMIEL